MSEPIPILFSERDDAPSGAITMSVEIPKQWEINVSNNEAYSSAVNVKRAAKLVLIERVFSEFYEPALTKAFRLLVEIKNTPLRPGSELEKLALDLVSEIQSKKPNLTP